MFVKNPNLGADPKLGDFTVCNYIDLFIPVAILESDRLFSHAQSLQLAGWWHLNAYLAKIPEIAGAEFWSKKAHFEIEGAG